MRRLGLYLSQLPGFDKRGYNRRELIECVRAAEACGYESFWMPEAWGRDAFIELTTLASRTEKIKLATGVVNVFSRSPALLAMSAATIDEISGGRFSLGLGTSGPKVIEGFHGVQYEKPLTRLRETIEIIRLALAGERIDFKGESFNVSRFKLGFKPLRKTIPIYVAALRPRSIRLAAETADGWLPTCWPIEKLGETAAEMQRIREQTRGENFGFETAPFLNIAVSDDLRKARDEARLPIAYYVGGMGDYYHASISRLGWAGEADRIRDHWQSGRPRDAMASATDDLIEAIAICGPAARCRARLDEVLSIGATRPLIPIPRSGTVREKCRAIESLVS
jgi:F420-dependent oxidoreductase-like protein